MGLSAPALLIVAGLVVLALACSVFPVAPTPRAALAFLIASILCFFIPLYIGIAIALGTTSLVIVDALLSAQNIRVKRTMPVQLARGVPAPFRIATENAITTKSKSRSFLPTKIRQPRCADIHLTVKEALDDLRGEVTAHRRGLHSLPPYATRTTGPLGLAVWHRPYNQAHEIKVFPDLPAANRLAHAIQQGRFATAGLKRKGPLGLGTNFESVRDYYPDDDMRNVNWSATARTGKPMTNQYRVEQDRDVIVVLDTGRLMTAPLPLYSSKIKEFNKHEYHEREDEETITTPSVTRLDIALDALCGLVSVADVMGDRSGVIAFNSSVKKHLKPRRAGANAVIKTVFDLEPVPVDSDFEAAFARVGKAKRSFLLILTDFMDPQSNDPLIRALRTVVKKHRVVVASILDPDISNILEIQNPNHEESLLQWSATEMLTIARLSAEKIKQAGAEVVYCSHEDLMLECVKSYIHAKQRASF